MSIFDPNQLLQTETTEALDTRLTPVPQGEWDAQITDLKFREAKKRDTGEPIYFLDVYWEIQNPEVKETTGRDKNVVRQSLIVDIDGDRLDFSKNKNVQLGALREALGQNKKGQKWSPAMLQGQMAKVMVTHKPDQHDVPFPEVKKVGKL